MAERATKRSTKKSYKLPATNCKCNSCSNATHALFCYLSFLPSAAQQSLGIRKLTGGVSLVTASIRTLFLSSSTIINPA
jgi:hypothetical protein